MAAGDPIPWSYIAKRVATASLTADSGTWQGTETTALLSATATLVNGQIYAVRLSTNVSVDVAGDVSQMRVREGTASGSQLCGPMVYGGTTNTSGFPCWGYFEYTATSSGSQTFVVTGQRNSGTGTAHRIRASVNRPTFLTVDLILS